MQLLPKQLVVQVRRPWASAGQVVAASAAAVPSVSRPSMARARNLVLALNPNRQDCLGGTMQRKTIRNSYDRASFLMCYDG